MGPFEIAAIAIIGGFIIKGYTAWLNSNRGGGGNNKKVQELERRIEALESQQNVKALQERVNILEEIVTTDEFELQKKFRRLEAQDS